MNPENLNKTDDLASSTWGEEGKTPEGEKRVSSEFGQWLASLRDCELASKAARLWRLFKDGKLSAADKAIIVAALLYCLSPLDLMPDILPVVGYMDDLLVVIGVLASLDKKDE